MPEVVHPALYPRNLFPNSKITMFWHGNQSEHLAGRKPIVPSGGTLGGGSAMNWMVYTRAQRSDFDSWKSPGWSADEMLPFLKKVGGLLLFFFFFFFEKGKSVG
jgi:alcohol oxidase